MKNFKRLSLLLFIVIFIAGINAESFGSFEDDKSNLKWSGDIKLNNRNYLDIENEIETTLEINLNLKYERDNSELYADFEYLTDDDSFNLNEAYVRLFYDNFDFLAGKKKVIWGKGDKLHVIDNINPEDYSDFINEDYLDRKISEKMLKIDYYIGNGNFEIIFIPEFNYSKLPEEGFWVQKETRYIQNLENELESYGLYLLDMGVITNTELNSMREYFKDETSYPDYDKIEESTFGLRYTNSIKGFDFGFSYYNGRMKLPSYSKLSLYNIGYSLSGLTPDPSVTELNGYVENIDPHYDKVEVFGFEFSKILLGINTRGEIGYFKTEDSSGDNPDIRNHKVSWVIGGDRDFPVSNINLNLQLKSEKILKEDEIKKNSLPLQGYNYDINYNKDGNYFKNLLVAKLSDSYNHEKIEPEIIYYVNIESEDYVLENNIEFLLKDNLSMKMIYKIFEGEEDTQFGQFDDNDYAALNFEYSF